MTKYDVIYLEPDERPPKGCKAILIDCSEPARAIADSEFVTVFQTTPPKLRGLIDQLVENGATRIYVRGI